jgi:hypothetical protein
MANRTGRGWFQAGNKGNPNAKGRPRVSRRTREYSEAVMSVATPEVIADVVQKLVDRATVGTGSNAELKAIELLLKCVLGSDPAAVLDLYERLETVEEELQRQEQEQAIAAPQWERRSVAAEERNVQDAQEGTANGNGNHADGPGGVNDDQGGDEEDRSTWHPMRLF